MEALDSPVVLVPKVPVAIPAHLAHLEFPDLW